MKAQKILFLLIAAGYFGYCIATPGTWHLIDAANLIFHEAGHTLAPAFIFGQWFNILAGSLLQVLVPFIVLLYFLNQGDLYSPGIVALWLGQSIVNVSVYASDALQQALPLLGGDDVIHDWNYLLNSLGLVKEAHLIGSIIYFIGIATVILGCVIGLSSVKDKEKIWYNN